MMKAITKTIFLLLFSLLLVQCRKEQVPEPIPNSSRIEVINNEIPYVTERFFRIGYTLKLWEFGKDGLIPKKITILDAGSGETLLEISENEMPPIILEPLPPLPYFVWDTLDHYYISIQVPVPLTHARPHLIKHVLTFRDSINHLDVTMEGGFFNPRIDESPVVISSPVKGDNWLFVSQSTMGYHFFVLLFLNGQMWRPERFAFDNAQMDDQLTNILNGDPAVNESYFNYGDTLYGLAGGKVVKLRDGRAENHGDTRDVPINSIDEYAGNYLILDLGNENYACYGHIMPGSFFVGEGDSVSEGDPVARLGNSGNSGMPHLHFQVVDRPDFLFSQGVPFVLKRYLKINEFDPQGNLLNPPRELIYHSMMEERSVIGF